MTQQTSPFVESKYGWDFGEAGWHVGADENWLKLGYLHDNNVDGVVGSLPAAVNGEAYFLTTDSRFYFAVGTSWYSSPCPKWFIFKVRSTGMFWQFDGTTAVEINNPQQANAALEAIQDVIDTLGTAAFVSLDSLATQAELDVAIANAAAYTDDLRSDLASTVTGEGSYIVGFKQRGTGTTNRIVDSKLKETVSVKDFGAIGDGVTDDTAAFLAAISSGIKHIYIPDETFICSNFSISTPDIQLFGKGIIKQKSGISSGNFITVNAANVSIDGIVIDRYFGFGVITTANATGISVKNCSIIGAGTTGISVRLMEVGSVLGCTVLGCTAIGIEVRDARRIIIDGNTVRDSGSGGIQVFGTTAGACSEIQILNNAVYNSTQAGIAAPFISSGVFGVDGIVISGNRVVLGDSNGIAVQCRNATVTGNLSTKNGTSTSHQGILLNGVKLTVSGNVSSYNTGVGIDCGNCTWVSVVGNTVTGNGIFGIEVNSCDFASIIGNNVSENWSTDLGSVPDTSKSGIIVSSGTQFGGFSNDVVVSGNLVTAGDVGNYQKYGVSCNSETRRVRITGNNLFSGGVLGSIYIETPSSSYVCNDNEVADTVAESGGIVTIPFNGSFFIMNYASITQIVTPSGTYERGRRITILFTGAGTITDGGNLRLNGSLTYKSGDTLTLVAESGNWYEVSRSVN